jgi:prephenate dehydratase
MSPLSMEQIRGLNDLVQDGVTAGIDATERVHRAIARQPYALLEKIDAIAAPVQAIEQCQQALTDAVYATVRGVHGMTAGIADRLIERLSRAAEPASPRQ